MSRRLSFLVAAGLLALPAAGCGEKRATGTSTGGAATAPASAPAPSSGGSSSGGGDGHYGY